MSSEVLKRKSIGQRILSVIERVGNKMWDPVCFSRLFVPMFILLGFVRLYDKDAGLGTLMSNMIPYSLTFAIRRNGVAIVT